MAAFAGMVNMEGGVWSGVEADKGNGVALFGAAGVVVGFGAPSKGEGACIGDVGEA